MSDYKRLTVRHPNSDYIAITETKQLQETRESKIVLNRLAELEDKIEDGTLIEFNKPFYSNQFNAWCIYLKDGDYIKSLCLTKEQAETKLKELQEEQK